MTPDLWHSKPNRVFLSAQDIHHRSCKYRLSADSHLFPCISRQSRKLLSSSLRTSNTKNETKDNNKETDKNERIWGDEYIRLWMHRLCNSRHLLSSLRPREIYLENKVKKIWKCKKIPEITRPMRKPMGSQFLCGKFHWSARNVK